MPDTEWPYQPGDHVVRSELHDRFGGSRQSGISPSARSPVVLIFTDPAHGPEHGYYDGWAEDGRFEYTGQGRTGDQSVDEYPNRELLLHSSEGRSGHLFKATSESGVWEYVTQLVIDSVDPFHFDRAHSTGGGPMRDVVVFHLLPVDGPRQANEGRLNIIERQRVTIAAIEARNTERYLSRPHTETLEKERREQELLERYAHWVLSKTGVNLVRYIYTVHGKNLACDAFDPSRDLIIEAKSSTDRNSIRMAVGQLVDYARFHENPQLAVLVPRDPGLDLLGIVQQIGAGVIYPVGDRFEETWPNRSNASDGHS